MSTVILLERGPWPTGIASTLNGNYIIDGKNWISISEGMNLKDAKVYYETLVKQKLTLKLKDLPSKQWEVRSSSGESVYIVRLWNNGWTCNCLGYQYRKSCRHIEECKQLMKG